MLLQDPVVQWFKWNQDALDRASTLCADPAHRADVVRRTIHNSSAKQEDVGCLLEQVGRPSLPPQPPPLQPSGAATIEP